MGTTAEKGARVLQSIAEVQEGINNLGGSLTDQTPFKDFKAQLDNIYDVLPKTAFQTGTDVTLENCLKGKLDYENGVVGIGQASQESTNGYQMLNLTSGTYSANGITAVVENGGITLNGTCVNSTSFIVIPCTSYTLLSNVDYILSAFNSFSMQGNNGVRLGSSGTTIAQFVSENNTRIIKYTSDTSFSTIEIRTEVGATYNNSFLKPMLEKGTTAHEWEKYTGGQASPNPSYPQKIKVVRGKNWFDNTIVAKVLNNNTETVISTGKRVTYTGTTTTSTTNFVAYAIMDLSNYVGSTIRFKANFQASASNIGNYYIGLCDSNGETRTPKDNANRVSGQELSFVVPILTTGQTYLCLGLYSNVNGTCNQNDYVDYTNIILTIDNEDMSYLPYNTIEEVVSGINEFDIDTADYANHCTLSNGVYTTEALSSSNRNVAVGYTEDNRWTINNNETYYFSADVRIKSGTASKVGLMRFNFSGLTATALENPTLSSDFQRIFFRAINESGASLSGSRILFQISTTSLSDAVLEIKNILVTKVNTSTYEPYHTPTTYQLSLGDIELCGIGNYKDELIYDVDEDRVYKNEKIGKYTFTGNEQFSTHQYGTNSWQTNRLVDYAIVDDVVIMMNTKFKGIPYLDRSTAGEYSLYSNNNNIFFRNTSFTTQSAIQEALSGTPLYYCKATSTEMPITDTTLINQVKALYNAQSNNGTTIITSNGDLPMIIKCRALKST